ncbi:MAG: glycosyltransferase, partial [Clostridia bacterium]
QRDKLENKCKKEEIKNIVFKGRVEKKYVPYICSKADINIINVMPTDINRYGVSWNKLFDYMVAGKPIVSTVKVNYDYIEKYNCGETTENQNVETIANAIIEIKNMSKDEYESMCQNARNAAKDFDFNVLTNKLEEVVNFTMEKK